MLTWLITGVALAAVAYLIKILAARVASDRIQQFMDRRRASSRLVSHGELIDGNRHLPVALALDASTLYYESSDLQASLDLQWIGDVEYDGDVVTGQYAGSGNILTIRCYSQAFRFLIPVAALPQWQAALPPGRYAAREDPPALNADSNRADDDGWPIQAVAETAAS